MSTLVSYDVTADFFLVTLSVSKSEAGVGIPEWSSISLINPANYPCRRIPLRKTVWVRGLWVRIRAPLLTANCHLESVLSFSCALHKFLTFSPTVLGLDFRAMLCH